MPDYYRRDGSKVAIDYNTAEGLAVSSEIWSHEYRLVARDYLGATRVSTVFLVIDHSWLEGPPILFETMVFGYECDDSEYQWRYPDERSAIAGHAIILKAVRRGDLTQETLPYIFTK